MSNLSQLLEGTRRAQTVNALTEFVETTVSEQSGLSGMAIKGAVGAATKVDADIVPKGVNKALPGLLGDLEPLWQEYQGAGAADFGTFVEPRSAEVANSIVDTADKLAEKAPGSLAKAYGSLRNKAAKILEAKVPDIARVIEAQMG